MRLQNLFMSLVKLECFKANGKKKKVSVKKASKGLLQVMKNKKVSKQPFY